MNNALKYSILHCLLTSVHEHITNIKSTFNFCGEFDSIDGLLMYNSNRRVKILIERFFSGEAYGKSEISGRSGLCTGSGIMIMSIYCLVFPVCYRILTASPLSVRNKTSVGGSTLAFSDKQWGLLMNFQDFFSSVAVRSCTENCTVLITDISSVPPSAEKVKEPWRILSVSQTIFHLLYPKTRKTVVSSSDFHVSQHDCTIQLLSSSYSFQPTWHKAFLSIKNCY